jgi:hypothetical protein
LFVQLGDKKVVGVFVFHCTPLVLVLTLGTWLEGSSGFFPLALLARCSAHLAVDEAARGVYTLPELQRRGRRFDRPGCRIIASAGALQEQRVRSGGINVLRGTGAKLRRRSKTLLPAISGRCAWRCAILNFQATKRREPGSYHCGREETSLRLNVMGRICIEGLSAALPLLPLRAPAKFICPMCEEEVHRCGLACEEIYDGAAALCKPCALQVF